MIESTDFFIIFLKRGSSITQLVSCWISFLLRFSKGTFFSSLNRFSKESKVCLLEVFGSAKSICSAPHQLEKSSSMTLLTMAWHFLAIRRDSSSLTDWLSLDWAAAILVKIESINLTVTLNLPDCLLGEILFEPLPNLLYLWVWFFIPGLFRNILFSFFLV